MGLTSCSDGALVEDGAVLDVDEVRGIAQPAVHPGLGMIRATVEVAHVRLGDVIGRAKRCLDVCCRLADIDLRPDLSDSVARLLIVTCGFSEARDGDDDADHNEQRETDQKPFDGSADDLEDLHFGTLLVFGRTRYEHERGPLLPFCGPAPTQNWDVGWFSKLSSLILSPGLSFSKSGYCSSLIARISMPP